MQIQSWSIWTLFPHFPTFSTLFTTHRSRQSSSKFYSRGYRLYMIIYDYIIIWIYNAKYIEDSNWELRSPSCWMLVVSWGYGKYGGYRPPPQPGETFVSCFVSHSATAALQKASRLPPGTTISTAESSPKSILQKQGPQESPNCIKFFTN